MFGVDDIVGGVLSVVNKFIPDAEKQAELQLEIAKLKQQDEFKRIDAALQTAQQQTDINKIEAGNSNLFVSGARPAAIWVCVIAFAYHYVLQPLAVFVMYAYGYHFELPKFDMDALFTLLFGLLGLSGMRSFDKMQGTSK